MGRKIFLILIMFLFILSFLNAGQKRLTTHRIYYNPVGDGRGNIFYSKHVSGEYWDLIQVDEFGGNLRQLTNDNLVEMYSRDSFKIQGKPVIIKMGKDNDIISIGTASNIDINSITNIFSTQLSISNAIISPDGMKVAFVAVDKLLGEKTGTLYIMNIDGTNPRSLGTSIPVCIAENVKLENSFEIPGSTYTKKNVSMESNLQFSPDSKQISYVNSSGELVILNLTGGAIGGPLVITGYEFYNHYWLKSGRIMFLSSNNLGTISSDGKNYMPVYSSNGSILDYAVSPDESKIAVVVTSFSTGNNLSIVILNSSGTILNQMVVSSRQLNSKISWVTDSKIVFGDMLNIFTLGITGAQTPQNITNNTDFIENLETARGNKIVYRTYNGEINTMNLDGSGRGVLVPSTTSTYVVDMILSPSGQKILISINDSSGLGKRGLYVKNTDGTGTDVIIEENNTYSYYFPEFNWSPTEDSVIYRSALDSAYYMVTPDGKNKKPVLIQGDIGSNFIFSPDGKKLIFSGYLMSQQLSGVFITDLTSYQIIPTSYSISCYPLAWKSDTILLEETEVPGKLYVIKPDGTLKKQIDIGPYSKIKLSPDGKKLAFTREASQEGFNQRDYGLFIIIIEDNISSGTGSGVLPVIPEIKLTPSEYADFDWSGDSKLIAYEHSVRNTEINRIFMANSDGTSPYLLNPAITIFTSNPFFVSDNRIVYFGDMDIWIGDFNAGVPPEQILPYKLGDIKIVVPEESGRKGTINPSLGKPIPIGFKPSDETITEGEYTLRIFNNLGKKVYEEKRNFTPTDDKYFDWIPQNLPTGLYIVHISGPGVNVYKKVPILR